MTKPDSLPTHPPRLSHPPKPRLALSVGVTGHRPNRLPASGVHRISAEVADVLRQIQVAIADVQKRHAAVWSTDDPRLSVVSSLAEGADRIVAEAGLAAGFELEAPLPFAAETYAEDFADAASRQAFSALLTRAARVVELPGQRAAADQAYERAGLAMLDHAALLIAIWDGGPAAGRGGTPDMLEAAARRGIPVVVIAAADDTTPPTIRWRDLDRHPRTDLSFHDLPPQPIGQLGRVIEQLTAPPVHGDEVAHLADYLREGRRHIQFRQAWLWLQAMAFMRRPRWRDFYATSPETAADDEAAAHAGAPPDLTAAYGWADALANYYAQIFRSAVVVNFLCAALAVFVVALSILVGKSFGVKSIGKPVFVGIEILLLLWVVLNTIQGRRRAWHRRWLEAREVAERLRVALPMHGLAARPTVQQGRIGIWTAWYERALLRAAGLPVLRPADDHGIRARTALHSMLDGQCRYHGSTHKRMHQLEHRLETFGELLFVLTLIVATVYMAVELSVGPIRDSWQFLVTALTAGLPVLATAAYGIRVIGDFEGSARRSKRMAADITALIAAMEADDAAGTDGLAAAQERARQAADIMLGDVASWRVAAEGRTLAIPG
ncbi:hypothetical protein [Tistrella mobilis]|uniref:hypothetical protein n=1 Tax=Tistrella mobilis TaxID=171437 RepID=UPI000306A3B8|nr:hypothetical protein [Tistrella mobilis]